MTDCSMSFYMKTILAIYFTYFLKLVISAPTEIETPSISKADATEITIAKLQLYQNQSLPGNITENGISGPCKRVTVLFAKGTGEGGNVGDGSSPGPPWFAELRKSMGEENVAVQGVPYSANVIGFLRGGDPEGTEKLLNFTNEAVGKCPNSKIIIGGYSQGAQLVHNAAKKFSNDSTSKIHAVVLFGDPDLNQTVGAIPSSDILTICHDGDIICQGLGTVEPHLTYGDDAAKAASFVMEKIQ